MGNGHQQHEGRQLRPSCRAAVAPAPAPTASTSRSRSSRRSPGGLGDLPGIGVGPGIDPDADRRWPLLHLKPSVQQTERPRLPIIDGPEALTKQSITEKRSDGSFQVRFARRIPHPIERVWEALTDAELRKWWGDADLHPDPGAPTTLTWGLDPDGDHTRSTSRTRSPAPSTTTPPPQAGICTSTPSPSSSPAARSTSPTRPHLRTDPPGLHRAVRHPRRRGPAPARGAGDAGAPGPGSGWGEAEWWDEATATGFAGGWPQARRSRPCRGWRGRRRPGSLAVEVGWFEDPVSVCGSSPPRWQ